MKTYLKQLHLVFGFTCVMLIPQLLKAQTIQIAFNVKTYNGGYNVSCYGVADGKIDIIVVGGTWPYTYLWSNGAVTKNLNGVAASTYTVTVTDLNNATAQSSVTLTQTKVLEATLVPSEYTGGYNISETVSTMDISQVTLVVELLHTLFYGVMAEYRNQLVNW